MTEVTIIIPNYNGKKLLENCIKTLERQTCQEFKLLVIDNGSKDGSTDVTSESLDMEMVALPENTGFCGAVNLGFEMTTTPYAILLNNDTEAEPHFVEELLKGIRQSERIFSCGAQMLDFKQRELLDNAGDLYTLPGWAVARGHLSGGAGAVQGPAAASGGDGGGLHRDLYRAGGGDRI